MNTTVLGSRAQPGALLQHKRAALQHLPSLHSKGPARRVASRVAKKERVVAVTPVEDPSPFFEPLVRSFLLGVGASVICESAHVLFKFAGLAIEVGSQEVVNVLPHVVDRFSPLFVWDHVVAVGSWALLYAIEAVAVLAVLQRYPNDKEAAARKLSNMKTLPRKMLPANLTGLKSTLYKLLFTNMQPAQAALTAGSSAAPKKPEQLSNTSNAATAVLDRPTTAAPPQSSAGIAAASTVLDRPAPRTKLPEFKPNGTLKDRPSGLRPGQLDPASTTAAKRAKELQDRKKYLKNFWYAAALSENIKDKPVGVDILGRRIVLFRDDQGTVQCLDDACPHRGAPLSLGWTDSKQGHSCVVCPYHGWAFDGEGRLRDVPASEEEGRWPKRPVVGSFPVEEKGGFVWLFFGSKSMPAEERPPIPFIPELEAPGWKAVYGEVEFEHPHWGVFENAIDMAHIHYLHNTSFGNQDNPQIHRMKVERDTFNVGGKFTIHNKPVSPMWQWTSVPEVPVEFKAFLPSTSFVRIQLGAGVSMITFVNTVPIDEKRSINRFCLIRNFAESDVFDGYTRKAMYRILGEDKVMVELLRPEALPHEISLEADLPQIAFRKLRQEWIDLGYGVSPTEAQQKFNGLTDM